MHRNLRMKCPFDCVDCALNGYAMIEPPAQEIQGTERILVANFLCIWLSGKIGEMFIHSFPEDKLEQLLLEREKILKVMDKMDVFLD